MRLGAQLYSVRNQLCTGEETEEGFRRFREMEYDVVQVSGLKNPDAVFLKKLSDRYSLPITLTHSPLDRILNDTERLIEEHKIMNCPVIGLGCMPADFIDGKKPAEEFFALLKEPVRKIRASGLRFGYHNHYFEFGVKMQDGTPFMEALIEEHPEIDVILDVYWVKYAGFDSLDLILRLKGRLANVHFKDMTADEKRDFCPCGSGSIDFSALCEACEKAGTENVLVEQDNATFKTDPYGEMEQSLKHLFPLIHG